MGNNHADDLGFPPLQDHDWPAGSDSMSEAFGETRIAKLLQVAASDVGVAAAHYNFGEARDAIDRINTALNLLSTAKAKILLQISNTNQDDPATDHISYPYP